jgi:uncharacterized membrane protein YfcA
MYLIIGLVAGVMSGLFGIGGGGIIVPILTALLKFDAKRAMATSLGALLLPVGLPGVLYYHNKGELSFVHALPVAIGLLIGVIFGAMITIRLPSKAIKLLFGIFLLVVALRFIFF